MNKRIITSLSKFPEHKVTTVLIVGDQGTGKHQLGEALVAVKIPFSLEVRTATTLPLPDDASGTRRRIDYVVFIVDLSSKKSMSTVAKCVSELDVSMFLGRCCFVATRVTEGEIQTVGIESITELANAYDSPLFTGNFRDPKSLGTVAEHILKMAATSSGVHNTCSSLLVGATQTPVQLFL